MNNEWELATLSEIIGVFQSGVSVNAEDRSSKGNELAVLKVSSVSNGKFIPMENKVIVPDELARAAVSPQRGDIIVSRANTTELVGSSGYVEEDFPWLYLSDKLWRIRIKDEKRDHPHWLLFVLNSPKIRRSIGTLATGSSGSMKNLSQAAFLKLEVERPPYSEQCRISEILKSWQRDLIVKQSLCDLKSACKNSLMHQLLAGKRRFENFQRSKKRKHSAVGELPSDWELVRLSALFGRVVRKNTSGLTRVLTASGQHGLVDQSEYFNRTVAGDNREKYYLLNRGEFAYNRSLMNGYPFGAIKRLDRYDEGILSTLYLCFALKDKRCESDFYSQFFESGLLNKQLGFIAQMGARAHGLLNVTADDFFEMEVPRPSHDEQQKIADVLNTADREIDLLRHQLNRIKAQKKGLMQQLLTGKVRVNP